MSIIIDFYDEGLHFGNLYYFVIINNFSSQSSLWRRMLRESLRLDLTLLTPNYFSWSSLPKTNSTKCFWQSEVIESSCRSMKKFRFYCFKVPCIRSDIIQNIGRVCHSEVFIVSNTAWMFQTNRRLFKFIS